MSVELEKRVDKLETELREVKNIAMDNRTRIAVAESNITDIKADLSSIKQDTNWIIRLIIGAIILAIIGFLISGGLK
jgi:hypothetical protein